MGQRAEEWVGELSTGELLGRVEWHVKENNRASLLSLCAGEIPAALKRLVALEARARALLDGTTPGPWRRDDRGEDIVAPHQHGRYCTPEDCDEPERPTTVIETDSGCYVYNDRDHEMIVGAHALLTELAK